MNIDTFRLLYFFISFVVMLILLGIGFCKYWGLKPILYYFIMFAWFIDGVEKPIVPGNMFYMLYQYFFTGTSYIRFLWGFGVLYPYVGLLRFLIRSNKRSDVNSV